MNGISWTDQTWNPIVGCSHVSAGCDHCWAERMAKLHYHSKFPNGWSKHGPISFPERLEQPLHWRKPRRIAVALMGDLFHDAVPDEFIDKVFTMMAFCRRHTFQLLTKRPDRMHAYFLNDRPGHIDYTAGQLMSQDFGYMVGSFKCLRQPNVAGGIEGWPLPNVWLGVSCENQAAAAERIPLLLQTPAAVRFVSCEPLLGPINLDGDDAEDIHALGCGGDCDCAPKLDWVIVGGETGPGARPMHPDWARSLRDQCRAAGVPFHFKQWGEWRMFPRGSDCLLQGNIQSASQDDSLWFKRLGKKSSGRLLDGREWLEFPEAKA